jgi:hypothetical protein
LSGGESKGQDCGSGGESSSASLCGSEVSEIYKLLRELVVSTSELGGESGLGMHLVAGVGEDEITGIISSVELSE